MMANNKDFIPFITLLARVTNDGYLLGVTDNLVAGTYETFWPDMYEDKVNDDWLELGPVELPSTWYIQVPEDMYWALILHGTHKQIYSDGYEAWQDVIRYGAVAVNGSLKGVTNEN